MHVVGPGYKKRFGMISTSLLRKIPHDHFPTVENPEV
jgi:hypothetical protein